VTAESDSGPKPTERGVRTEAVVVFDRQQDLPGQPGPQPRTEAVVVFDRQQDLPVDEGRWAGLMRSVLTEESVATPWEVGLSFVAAEEMAALNAQYRGIDRPTDVLAFGVDDGTVPRADQEPRLVGDVVVCPSAAASNAEARGNSVESELALLVVHGTLHLLGYDHIDDSDAVAMQGRERELVARSMEGLR